MLAEYNTEYATWEFLLHGEYQMMQKLAHVPLPMIFDVGCNIGEWTRMARSFQPASQIHMFEIMPATFQKLLRNNVLDPTTYPNSFGLSNDIKQIPVKYVPNNDRVSTTVLEQEHHDSMIKNAYVVTGDSYCQNQPATIEYIDFLKIDSEGHEYEVLQGFMGMLSQQRIGCIQFEYGNLNILTKHLLIDFSKMLVPLGYVLGKITPARVNFKDYHLLDEDFRGPDYMAVHISRTDIIDALK